MRLLGLTLDTNHFDEYLSFLTEVLELDLSYLDGESMHLTLQGTELVIRKASFAPQHKDVFIRFLLSPDEYESLVNKLSFFSYRKGKSAFSVRKLDIHQCHLLDPDGRAWCFSHTLTTTTANSLLNL